MINKFISFYRYIDHGNGLLTLRIRDPFIFDSGRYSCIITTVVGDCMSECEVEIEELCDANIYDLIPEFVKAPLPAITLLGGSASFCTRITPVDSDVVWSICGREIKEDTKQYKVSLFFPHLYATAKVNR